LCWSWAMAARRRWAWRLGYRQRHRQRVELLCHAGGGADRARLQILSPLATLLAAGLGSAQGAVRARALHLSLSRLNHWLPWAQAHPEVMQGTTEFHHEITHAVLLQPDPVFDDTTALDAAVDMLDPQPTVVQGLVGPLLLQRQLLAAGFLRRHEDLHLREHERQEAEILQQPASRGQGIRRRGGNRLIMDAAAVGVAQEEDEEQGMHEQDIF